MKNGVILFVTLAVAAGALIAGSLALRGIGQLEKRIEEANANVCLDCDEAMRSIADSFKANRLDYSLTWTTPEGTTVIAGAFK